MACPSVIPGDYWTLVAFLAMGALSHARGCVLLLREARSWFLRCQAKRKSRKTPVL